MYTPKYTKDLSEPWFTLVNCGKKTVEGRINQGSFEKMDVGDIIKWTNNIDLSTERSILTKIIDKIKYTTFEEYLIAEGLNNCLPGITNITQGLDVYFKFYNKEQEKEYGVIAFRLKVLD